MLTLKEGTIAVALARKSISSYLESGKLPSPPKLSSKFSEKLGVFVTLKTISGDLRGCIGFPEPWCSLAQGIIEAAAAAAFEDPRFPPVSESELDDLTIEVSVLTTPQEIPGKPEDRIKKIKIGRDGLILRSESGSGLLLPQVPVEENWSIEEYLAGICMKAGVQEDAWKDPNAKLFTFQAQVFSEANPNKNPAI